jgi:hypothetical protein
MTWCSVIHYVHRKRHSFLYCNVVWVTRLGMDWWMDLLTTYTHPLRTTSNYSAIANLHNSQITTATAEPYPACCVFTSCSLATASNSGDHSASHAQVLPVRQISCSWTVCFPQLSWDPRYIVPVWTQQKTPPQQFHCFCCGQLPSDNLDIVDVFTSCCQATAFDSLFDLRSLPSNRSVCHNIYPIHNDRVCFLVAKHHTSVFVHCPTCRCLILIAVSTS